MSVERALVMRERARAICAIVAATALLSVLVPARAHDGIPSVTLRAQGGTQRANIYDSSQADGVQTPYGSACFVSRSIGHRVFPEEPIDVDAREITASFVVHHTDEPLFARLEAWRLVDLDGEPVGDPERVNVQIKKMKAGSSHKRWKITFTPPFHLDNYLDLYVQWPNVRECADPAMTGSWAAHLRVLGL